MEIQNGDAQDVSRETSSDAEKAFAQRGKEGFGRRLVRFGVSLGGILVFVIFVVAVSVWQQRSGMRIPGAGNEGAAAISSKVLISSVGENAFGNLANLSSGSLSADDSGRNYAAPAEGVSGGETTAPQSGGGGFPTENGSAKIATDGDMVYPYKPVYYTYVYEGEEFSQSEEKMNVLKRVIGNFQVSASVLTGALDFNLFDIGKLNNAKTANLSFFEDREFGYRTDIDLYNGSASIYKNYNKWPDYYADCHDEKCYSGQALKISDIPNDEELINAANAFLDDYRIDMSAYGAPQVEKDFMYYYDKTESAYVPDEIPIVYPLVVDGKTVYESYGSLNGLRVSYDIRNRKISSMYSLMTHNYQSSAYDAETDVAKILEAATGSGYDGIMPLRADDGTGVEYENIKIALDTPFLSYENTYRYENNESSEYLVPCLVFPVKESPETSSYSQKRVIVPLIKDFLQSYYGYPAIMKGGAAESAEMAAGSAGATEGGSVTDSAADTPVPAMAVP